MAGRVAPSRMVQIFGAEQPPSLAGMLKLMVFALATAFARLMASRRVQSSAPHTPSSRSAVRVTIKFGPLCAGSSASKAPLSQCEPCVRSFPRWSRLLTGAATQTASSPASIAALPAPSAIVHVGPPLLASAWRLICPVVLVVALSHEPSLSRLWLSALSVPGLTQSPPDGLLATMLFLSGAVPALKRPPPLAALLPLTVLLATFSVPAL